MNNTGRQERITMDETEFNKLVKEWADALDMSFGDFGQDTKCYPDCFKIKGKRLSAHFEAGNFVRRAVTFFLSNRNENEVVVREVSRMKNEEKYIVYQNGPAGKHFWNKAAYGGSWWPYRDKATPISKNEAKQLVDAEPSITVMVLVEDYGLSPKDKMIANGFVNRRDG